MIDPDSLDWTKMDGLIPAIVQHAGSGEVRMLGYMNRSALDATVRDGFVTFYSRSREELWRKGETSGNRLALVEIRADCDADALLVTAMPQGPTCHLGTDSCFGEDAPVSAGFLGTLAETVADRRGADPDVSYTASLFAAGRVRIAQKVGEEAVETILAATSGSADEFVGELADLLYHLTVLLEETGHNWQAAIDELQRRQAE